MVRVGVRVGGEGVLRLEPVFPVVGELSRSIGRGVPRWPRTVRGGRRVRVGSRLTARGQLFPPWARVVGDQGGEHQWLERSVGGRWVRGTWDKVLVVRHGLMADDLHMVQGRHEGGATQVFQVVGAFAAAPVAVAPCFVADVLCHLPPLRSRLPRWEVCSEGIERGLRQGVIHLLHTVDHPRSPGVTCVALEGDPPGCDHT